MTQNLLPVDALGTPHRLLRAFRSLLFLDMPELASQPAIMAALPPPVLVHHLYTRAPSVLQSPHTRSGYTPAQVRRGSIHQCITPVQLLVVIPLSQQCHVGTTTACFLTLDACTASQYSLWLDQHSMTEALKFNCSALEACASAVREEPGFGDMYQLMITLCSG